MCIMVTIVLKTMDFLPQQFEALKTRVEPRGSLIRVKIIVKQVEDGEKFFWSLIPSWGNHKLTGERILHDGNPEHD